MSTPDLGPGFLLQLRARNIEAPVRELVFHGERKWRFDFAWPDRKIAVEIEGGAWSRGRHTRGAGFREDCIKYGEAFRLGWTVLRVMPEQITSGLAADWLAARFHDAPMSLLWGMKFTPRRTKRQMAKMALVRAQEAQRP